MNVPFVFIVWELLRQLKVICTGIYWCSMVLIDVFDL